MVSFLYGPVSDATALTARHCQEMLANHALTHHSRLLPIALLTPALADRAEATLLVRHQYDRTPGGFVAPLADRAPGQDLYAPDLMIAADGALFSVLRGSTSDLIEHVRRLAARRDPAEFSFELLDLGPAPPESQPPALHRWDDGNLAAILAGLEAEDIPAAIIYDADQDRGLFAVKASALDDDDSVRGLGITLSPEFDRASFSDGARLWRSGGYAVMSQPAFKIWTAFARRLRAPLNSVSPEFRAMIDHAYAARPVVAAPGVARAAGAVERDPDWIVRLGPTAQGSDILRALYENDPEEPRRSFNRPNYVKIRLRECWTQFRPGLPIPAMESLKPSAGRNIHYSNNQMMSREVEREWSNFVTGTIEESRGPATERKVSAPPTDVDLLRTVLNLAAGGNVGRMSLRAKTILALKNLEVFYPSARGERAFALAKMIPNNAHQEIDVRTAWQAFTVLLGVKPKIAPRERADLIALIKDLHRRRAAQRPAGTEPPLRLSPSARKDAVRVGVEPAEVDLLVNEWHQIILGSREKGEAFRTVLFARTAEKVRPFVAFARNDVVKILSDGVADVDAFFAEAAVALNFTPFVIAAGEAAPARIVIPPAVQLEAWLAHRIDLSAIVRTIRRAEVLEMPSPLERIVRIVDGSRFALKFGVADDGSFTLVSMTPHAANEVRDARREP